MKFTSVFLLALFGILISGESQKNKNVDPEKQKIISGLDSRYDAYKNVAQQIWNFSELGFKEKNSSALLQKTLNDAGFKLEEGVAGMQATLVVIIYLALVQ